NAATQSINNFTVKIPLVPLLAGTMAHHECAIVPCNSLLFRLHSLERPVPILVQVLYTHTLRLAIRANVKIDPGRTNSIFSCRLVREYVAVVMGEWEQHFVWTHDHHKPAILLNDLDIAIE